MLAALVGLAFGVTMAALLLGGLGALLPSVPTAAAALVVGGVFLLLVTQVAGWYAIASLSIRTAVAAAVPAPGLPTVVAPNLVESFARGYLIGLNAGLNIGLWSILVPVGGVVVGLAVGLVNLLAAVGPLASTGGFQAGLGWASWLMPMSWLATGIGLVLFVVNLVAAPILGLGPVAVRLDVTTGTVESAGGITGATGFVGGFNLGNFTFITPGAAPTVFTVPGLSAHETGHGLNVAAFGSVWHLLGNAIEQNVPPFAFGARAYGEVFAESHLPRVGKLTLLQWS